MLGQDSFVTHCFAYQGDASLFHSTLIFCFTFCDLHSQTGVDYYDSVCACVWEGFWAQTLNLGKDGKVFITALSPQNFFWV